jgi:hypothetical protein
MENKEAKNGFMLNYSAKHYRKIFELSLWINLVFWVILGGTLAKMDRGAIYLVGEGLTVFLGCILGFFVGLCTNVIFGGLVATFLNLAKDVENINKLLSSQHNRT